MMAQKTAAQVVALLLAYVASYNDIDRQHYNLAVCGGGGVCWFMEVDVLDTFS